MSQEISNGSVAARIHTAVPAAPHAQNRPPGLSTTPDVLGLLKALRRRWRLALGLALLAAVVGGIGTYSVIPAAKYTAVATLQIDTFPRSIIFQTRERTPDYQTYQRTQVALIKNSKILSHALGNPEVAELPSIKEQVDEVEWLEQQLKVEFIGSSEILQVALSGDHPKDLAKIVNAVVKSYMSLVVEEERKERIVRLGKLKKLWEKYQSDLNAMRKSLKELSATTGANDEKALAMAQQYKADQLGVAQRERMRVQSDLLKAEVELAALRAKGDARSDPTVSAAMVDEQVERSPAVVRAQGQVDGWLQKYRAAYRIAQQPHDPSVRNARSQWEAAKKDLANLRERERLAVIEQVRQQRGSGHTSFLAQSKDQVSLLKAYGAALDEEIGRLQRESKTISENSLDLENKREGISIADEVSRKVGSEVEAVEVELEAPERVRLLGEAKDPKRKDETKKYKMGAMASLGSFAFVLLGISYLEFRTRRIDSADEVVSGLGIRLVGALPALPTRTRARVRSSELAATIDQHWQSLLIESIDAARTLLLHTSRLESFRVVMVTSAVKGEGKTSLACHLATSLARTGRKTLLVDCDLRRPSAHRLFDLPSTPGVCDLLRGKADLLDVVQTTPAYDLNLIPAGRCDATALQALARDDLRVFLERLKGCYDFIIVDSAPILPVADSLLIGQQVDAVIFSILRDVSRLPTVYSACERLASLGVKTLGAVVAGVPNYIYDSSYNRDYNHESQLSG